MRAAISVKMQYGALGGLRKALSTALSARRCDAPVSFPRPFSSATSSHVPGDDEKRQRTEEQKAADDIKSRINLPPPPPPSGNALVDRLNAALHTYPLTTSLVYLYHNPVYAGGVFGLFTLFGFTPPLDLGIAFALNGALRRLRIPIIFGLSAAVIKQWPSFAQLKVSTLISAPFAAYAVGAKQGTQAASSDSKSQTSNADALRTAPSASAADSGTSASASEARHAAAALNTTADSLERGVEQLPPGIKRSFSRVKGWVVDFFNPFGGTLTELMDRYGLAYILTARAVSTLNLLALYGALRYGADISHVMEWVGGSGETATGLVSRWAASAISINFIYPAVLHWGVSGLALSLGPRYEGRILQMAAESAVAMRETAYAFGKLRERRQDSKRGTSDI